MNHWKIYCMEDQWPGLWQTWFAAQAVAIGWPTTSGYYLRGPGTKDRSWNTARKRLELVQPGDQIIVQLSHHRIGRIGEVVRKRVEDGEWDPLVPRSKDYPVGEMGRRVDVRWDLQNGPLDPGQVILLPERVRLKGAFVRDTLIGVPRQTFKAVEAAARNEENWVGLMSIFSYERSVSDYIAAYPHRLEDGLVPYPSRSVREATFGDGS